MTTLKEIVSLGLGEIKVLTDPLAAVKDNGAVLKCVHKQ